LRLPKAPINTLVHSSVEMKRFITEEFRSENYSDLKKENLQIQKSNEGKCKFGKMRKILGVEF